MDVIYFSDDLRQNSKFMECGKSEKLALSHKAYCFPISVLIGRKFSILIFLLFERIYSMLKKCQQCLTIHERCICLSMHNIYMYMHTELYKLEISTLCCNTMYLSGFQCTPWGKNDVHVGLKITKIHIGEIFVVRSPWSQFREDWFQSYAQ